MDEDCVCLSLRTEVSSTRDINRTDLFCIERERYDACLAQKTADRIGRSRCISARSGANGFEEGISRREMRSPVQLLEALYCVGLILFLLEIFSSLVYVALLLAIEPAVDTLQPGQNWQVHNRLVQFCQYADQS